MDKIERKCRKIAEIVKIYRDADRVFCSVSTAERLLPLTDTVLSKNRRTCSPIMSLKINQRYWNLSQVCVAMSRRMSKKIIDVLGLQETEENILDFI